MMTDDQQAQSKAYLRHLWRNTFGPVECDPPTPEQCEKLGFSHEEGIAFYDECLAKSGMIEVKPGFWDYKK
jgi:hypothetical protein